MRVTTALFLTAALTANANATVIAEGPSFCGFVDEQAGKVAAAGGAVAALAGSFELGAGAAGAAAVAHSSEALILTQSGSYVAGTLGTVGPAAIAAAPWVLGAGLVTLAGAGAAYAYCSVVEG